MTGRMDLLLYDLQVRDAITLSLFAASAAIVGTRLIIDYVPMDPENRERLLNVYNTSCLIAWVSYLMLAAAILR